MRHEPAVGAHEIKKGRMVDAVIAVRALVLKLLVGDTVRFRRLGDVFRRSRQTDEIRTEIGNISPYGFGGYRVPDRE
ncbi:MAG: hypothetical protein A49_10100 [Methyloceanibacter sp.]|nr:MAG: hypothetical protein A49_10100 [Methyloceanibacter sp.]